MGSTTASKSGSDTWSSDTLSPPDGGIAESAVFRSKYTSRRSCSNPKVGTAHRFQGDECDIMVFSPVIAEGLPQRLLRWVARTDQLLNVSITRARAALHIVGDLIVAREAGGALADFAAHVSDRQPDAQQMETPRGARGRRDARRHRSYHYRPRKCEWVAIVSTLKLYRLSELGGRWKSTGFNIGKETEWTATRHGTYTYVRPATASRGFQSRRERAPGAGTEFIRTAILSDGS